MNAQNQEYRRSSALAYRDDAGAGIAFKQREGTFLLAAKVTPSTMRISQGTASQMSNQKKLNNRLEH